MNHTTPPSAPHPLCAVYDPLLPLLSLGALAANEEQFVLIHAASCDWCQRRLSDYDSLREMLRQSAVPRSLVPLSLTLEEVMSAAEQSPSTSPIPTSATPPASQRPRGRFAGLAALIAAVLVTALAGAIFAVHGLPTGKSSARQTTTASIQAHPLHITVTEFPVPSQNSSTTGMTVGPDHNIWFIDAGANAIGRITITGQVKEYPLPSAYRCDLHNATITVGPDGALWFVEDSITVAIGRITTGGRLSEYPLPYAEGRPLSIVVGSDGNLWFTENTLGSIGRITINGKISQFTIPTQAFAPIDTPAPVDITQGSDGALWFTDASTNAIGRITTSGLVTEYPTPTTRSDPEAITEGPDGALWFTENAAAKIGRITRQGVVTEYAVPSGSAPLDITEGPDGALWFTESSASGFSGDQIGRITLQAGITEFTLPHQDMSPSYIVTGPDGALWFTDYGNNPIGRITLGS